VVVEHLDPAPVDERVEAAEEGRALRRQLRVEVKVRRQVDVPVYIYRERDEGLIMKKLLSIRQCKEKKEKEEETGPLVVTSRE
jgi:hypothetical protein